MVPQIVKDGATENKEAILLITIILHGVTTNREICLFVCFSLITYVLFFELTGAKVIVSVKDEFTENLMYEAGADYVVFHE